MNDKTVDEKSMGRYIVGAYAAAPSQDGWDAGREGEYFAQLRPLAQIRGLELQFTGALHQDPAWLLQNLRRDWSFVLTTIGGAVGMAKKDPEAGIASDNPAGRQRGLDYLRKARDAVRQINDWAGRSAVLAVEIHSAPRPSEGNRTSAEALRQSLDELREWKWEGARLSMEHCDALIPGQTPEKGFLPLEAELQAIAASRGATPLGTSLNWGRSAVEARDAGAPERHLRQMRQAGLLNGVIFSGATVGDPDIADWADRHAPFSDIHNEKQRLLTPARLKACMTEIRDVQLAFLGVKISIPTKGLPVPQRVAEVKRCIDMLDTAVVESGAKLAA